MRIFRVVFRELDEVLLTLVGFWTRLLALLGVWSRLLALLSVGNRLLVLLGIGHVVVTNSMGRCFFERLRSVLRFDLFQITSTRVGLAISTLDFKRALDSISRPTIQSLIRMADQRRMLSESTCLYSGGSRVYCSGSTFR